MEKKIDATTYQSAISILEDNLKILHPFVPFISEEIWQNIKDRSSEEALIIAEWPKQTSIDDKFITDFETVKEIISGIRTIRKEKNISFKDTIKLSVINNEKLSSSYDSIIAKLGNIEEITYVEEQLANSMSYRVKSNEYFIPMIGAIDVEEEISKLTEELKYQQGFLNSVKKKLSNERFINNAPEKVVAIEKQKQADAEAKIEAIEQSLASLK